LSGFALTAAITLINGLHFHYPVVPSLRLRTEIGRLFSDKPWNAVGWTPIVVHPWIVGFVFFIPLDLSFSVWFFYLFIRFQRVIGAIAGWQSLPGFPYQNQQTSGGWIALSIIAIWLTRKHLKSFIIQAFRPSANADKGGDLKREPMSSRAALIGFFLGASSLLCFCMVAGMSLWIAVSFWILLIALEIAITRMRAELGPPQHGLVRVGPDNVLVSALGSRRLGGKNLTMLTYLYFTDRAVSTRSMPYQFPIPVVAIASSWIYPGHKWLDHQSYLVFISDELVYQAGHYQAWRPQGISQGNSVLLWSYTG
jgi:hypothetical protein